MDTTRRRFTVGGLGLTVVLPAPGFAFSRNSARFPWPGDKAAAVSLTYDDGLDSQLDNAVPALQRHGLRATFFLTMENMQARLQDWQAVAAQGNEIADHTFHHPCELKAYSAESFERAELDPTEHYLDEHFGPARRSFAYPCGVIELGAGSQLAGQLHYIEALRHRFVAARAADGDPNDPHLVGRQRYQLQAVAPTFERDDPAIALTYLRKAIAWHRWAILIFHNVLPTRIGEGDTTMETHDLILQWITRQNIWCAPMGEVFSHLV